MKRSLLLSVGAYALFAGPVWAQEAGTGSDIAQNQSDAIGQSDNTGSMLDVIVVTAQKRSQSLQDVPISITAVTGEKLEKFGADSLTDVSELVPSVTISTGVVNTNIYVRGVGTGLNRGFEQSVGMFIDGIYNGRSRQYRSPFLDAERVEVLRGPQGILFGRNTVAGAINVISASPEIGESPNGSVNLNYEKYSSVGDAQEIQGVVSSGISDSLAGRIAVKYRNSDGYIRNRTVGRTEAQDEEFTIRGTLVFEPTDNVSANLKLTYSDFNVVGSTTTPRVVQVIPEPALGGLDLVAFSLIQAADPNFRDIPSSRDAFETFRFPLGPGGAVSTSQFDDFGRFSEGNSTEIFNAALTVDWETDWGTFTSVTGYSEYNTADGLDADLLPIQFTWRDDQETFDQFSQELRFVSDFDGPFNFIAGAYYDEQNLRARGDILIDGSFGGLLQGALGVPSLFGSGTLITRNSDISQDTSALALFGEGTFEVTDQLRLIAGLRYARDKKDIDKLLTLGVDTNPNGDEFAAVDPDSTLGVALISDWLLFGTIPHRLLDERVETHWTPSAKIEWDAGDDLLLYLSYTQGYKGGGFNFTDDQAFENTTGLFALAANNGPFDQGDPVGFEFEDETVESLEFGIKSEFGGQFRFNASAFLTKYSNLQVSGFQGTTFIVGNAADSTIKGVEVEMEWVATDELTLNAGVGYLDFEYDSFENAGCQALQAADINAQFVALGGASQAAPLTSGLCSTGPNPGADSNSAFPAVQQDLSGQTSEFAPKWSGAVSATYVKPITDDLTITAGVDVNFSSKFFLDADLDPLNVEDGFARVNLRVDLASFDHGWNISLYGRNITGVKTFSHSSDIPLITGSHYANIDPPAVWGATLGYKF